MTMLHGEGVGQSGTQLYRDHTSIFLSEKLLQKKPLTPRPNIKVLVNRELSSIVITHLFRSGSTFFSLLPE
jgi:hypothetical protein